MQDPDRAIQEEERALRTTSIGHIQPGTTVVLIGDVEPEDQALDRDPVNILSHSSLLVASSDLYYPKNELAPKYINFQLTVTGEVMCLVRKCSGQRERLTVLYHGEDVAKAVHAANKEIDALVEASYRPAKAPTALRFDLDDIERAVRRSSKSWVQHHAA